MKFITLWSEVSLFVNSKSYSSLRDVSVKIQLLSNEVPVKYCAAKLLIESFHIRLVLN